MASAKGLLLDAFSFITRSVRITKTRDFGHGVRTIVLAGTDLHNEAQAQVVKGLGIERRRASCARRAMGTLVMSRV